MKVTITTIVIDEHGAVPKRLEERKEVKSEEKSIPFRLQDC